ncbi:MAG TPA: hypothetical protein VFD71_10695 [Planctomycetota bacterium]|nr:hypothetical protein [Planctomycetota bacterium]
MGSKSWSVIIGLGLACIVALGVLTKVAIDSSPDLQAIIRFKTAFAKDFEDRGVSEVSVRKQGDGGSSARLLLTIPPDAPGWRKGSAAPTSSSGSANSASSFDLEVAEYYLRAWGAKARGQLQIDCQSPSSFGCESAEVYHSTTFSIDDLRIQISDRESSTTFQRRLREELNVELIGFTRRNLELTVELGCPNVDPDALEQLAPRLELLARQAFRAYPYGTMRLKLRSSRPIAADPAATFEKQYDARGREIPDRAGDSGAAAPQAARPGSGSARTLERQPASGR